MEQLLTLPRLGVSTTLLDVDNALYMTAAVDTLSPEEQKRVICMMFLASCDRLKKKLISDRFLKRRRSVAKAARIKGYG